jgi:hypothetical protein
MKMKTPRSFAAIQAPSTYHGSRRRHFNGSRPDLRVPYREVSCSNTRPRDRSLPKGPYFVSVFGLDVKVPVSVAGSRLAEFYNLPEFLRQSLSSRCGNSGAQIAVCQSRSTGKRGLVSDVNDFGLRKSDYRRLRPRRSPTQGNMQ